MICVFSYYYRYRVFFIKFESDGVMGRVSYYDIGFRDFLYYFICGVFYYYLVDFGFDFWVFFLLFVFVFNFLFSYF